MSTVTRSVNRGYDGSDDEKQPLQHIAWNDDDYRNKLTERSLRNHLKKFSHFKILRKRCCRLFHYYHHFLIVDYNHDKTEVSVAHYTTNNYICTRRANLGVGEFLYEKVRVDQTDLFDTDDGLYIVPHEDISEDKDEIYYRLFERLGEQEYDFSWNNCEHVINYILTGKDESRQAVESPRLADCCNAVFGTVKEVGLKTAFVVSLLGAMAGSLTRYSYLRLIIAVMISYHSDLGDHQLCSGILGKNVLIEADRVIGDGRTIPFVSNIVNVSKIIDQIKERFHNSEVCEVAQDLAIEAIWKTCVAALGMSVLMESIFLSVTLCHSLLPLRAKGFLKTIIFRRILYVKIFGGYLSILMSIGLGALGQYMVPDRPALAFLGISFASQICLRYLLSVIGGMVFDYCCCCCDRCAPCCCGCKGGNSRCSITWFTILLLISLTGIAFTLFLTLD